MKDIPKTPVSTKTALKAFVKAAGDVSELQGKKVLDKSLAKFSANAEKKDGLSLQDVFR